MHGYTFRDSREAFDDAIKAGVLTEAVEAWEQQDPRYAGKWMYMHTEADGRDAFKNIDSRRYVWNPEREG